MKPQPSVRNLPLLVAFAMALVCTAIGVGLAATAQAQTETTPSADPAPSAAEEAGTPAGAAKRRSEPDPTFGDQDPDGDGSVGDFEPNPDDRDRDRDRDRIDLDDAKAPSIRSSVNRKAFFDSDRPARLKFELDYKDEDYFREHDIEAKVEVKRRKSGEVLERSTLKVNDSAQREVKWKGVEKGKLAKPGRYQFELTPLVDGDAVKMRNKRAPAPGGNFNFYTHQFPIDGKHDYGEKAARFGPRGGRKHLGHDVFAKCGTPLLAARGGKIQANQFQESAGFYVVIDGEETDEDYVYYHMKKRSKLKSGDKVKTGQVIGKVGDTGNAFGCHLHFERWTKPGWFEGGKAYDPLDSLKSWDKYS